MLGQKANEEGSHFFAFCTRSLSMQHMNMFWLQDIHLHPWLDDRRELVVLPVYYLWKHAHSKRVFESLSRGSDLHTYDYAMPLSLCKSARKKLGIVTSFRKGQEEKG